MNDLGNNHTSRMLVIGVGSIGDGHVRCFQNTHRAYVSICETNNRLRNEVGSRYNIASLFPDLSTALAEPHDAAVIAVPADLHIAVAQAVDAGLHVLIEKPLAVTMDGVEALAERVASANLVAAVGYVYRTPCSGGDEKGNRSRYVG